MARMPPLDWCVMATRTPARTGKRRKRKLSEKQRRIYRRRRIVVGVVLVLVLALVGFCVYSIGRGAFAVGALVAGHDVGIARKAVPDPTPSTGVRDCVEDSISLELSTTAQTVPVGGSIDFAAGIVYSGTVSCLIDGSDANRVLTITSGDDQVWRSDSCPVESRMLMMAQGDKDIQTMRWNTNRSGSECVDDADLPKVEAGTYVAQLSLKDHPEVVSQQVPFVVQ